MSKDEITLEKVGSAKKPQVLDFDEFKKTIEI